MESSGEILYCWAVDQDPGRGRIGSSKGRKDPREPRVAEEHWQIPPLLLTDLQKRLEVFLMLRCGLVVVDVPFMK